MAAVPAPRAMSISKVVSPIIAVCEGSAPTAAIGSEACGDLNLEAHLISPWGTWDWIGPASAGAVLPARSSVDVTFDVAPPSWAEPGQWWALIRIGCAGRLLYTEAAKGGGA